MRTPQHLYYPDLDEIMDTRILPKSLVHHANVLRMKAQNPLLLLNGRGEKLPVIIQSIDRHEAVLSISNTIESYPPPTLSIYLVVCIVSKKRMQEIMQKSVELGVHTIVPVISEWTQNPIEEALDKKYAYWNQVLISSCEQSGNPYLPQIAPIQPIKQYLSHTSNPSFIFHPEGKDSLPQELPQSAVSLIIGPEAGWSPSEITSWQTQFPLIPLGPRVMRVETASSSVVMMAQFLWGDLKNIRSIAKT